MDNLTKVQKQSLALLGKRLIPNICWSLLAFTGLITNAVILVIFLKYKKLKNKCGVTMTNLAISDIVFCSAHFWHGCRELYQYLMGVPITFTVQYCWYADIGWQMFSTSVNRYIALGLSMDRMLAVIAPMWYRKLDIKYSVMVNIFFWIWGFIPQFVSGLVALFSVEEKAAIPVCDISLVLVKWWNRPWGYYTWAVSALMLVSYGLVWIVVFIRFNKAKRERSNIQDVKDLIEFKTVKTMTIVIGLYLVCSFMVSGIVSNARQVGKLDMAVVIPTVKTLWIFNSAVNFFVYWATYQTFREGLKNVLGDGISSVWNRTSTVSPSDRVNNK